MKTKLMKTKFIKTKLMKTKLLKTKLVKTLLLKKLNTDFITELTIIEVWGKSGHRHKSS